MCHYFGWKLDYVLWGIDWRIIQRMLIDIPEYKDKDGKNEKGEYDFTQMSEESIEDLLRKYK